MIINIRNIIGAFKSMAKAARDIPDAVTRLKLHDPLLKEIILENANYTDFSLTELVECLLAHPNTITGIHLGGNDLTDKTGMKLAHFISISKSIEWVSAACNQFTEATYLAIAAALRTNTSLEILNLAYNQPVDKIQIDLVFVDALMINPNRSYFSCWYLFDRCVDFPRLKKEAEQLGHPNMQSLLVIDLNHSRFLSPRVRS